ncbi:MAG: helix-turn-helix transcriptional regulator [Eubacteriales bacterium]
MNGSSSLIIAHGFLLLAWGILLVGFVYIMFLFGKALRKYIKSSEVRQEKSQTKQSLGKSLKGHRTNSKMTQEFVAETLGVSRQAVSKWENGTSDPSTSNLVALAKLFGIAPEELIKEIGDNNAVSNKL